MPNDTRDQNGIKPAIIADVSAYNDTLEMFSKRRPDTILMTRLRDVQQRRVWFEPIFVRGTRWGYRLIINQPRPEALQLIHDWAVEVGADLHP